MTVERGFFLVTILLLIVLLLKDCDEQGTNGGNSDTISATHEKIYDTVRVVVEAAPTPKDRFIFTHSRDTIVLQSGPIDSNQVIKDYFTKAHFEYTYKDSNVSLGFSGNTWKNTVENGFFSYQVNRPTIVNNTTLLSKPRTKILIGAFALYNDKPTVGLSASLQTKQGVLITGGYGTGKTYYGGVQWPIKLRK